MNDELIKSCLKNSLAWDLFGPPNWVRRFAYLPVKIDGRWICGKIFYEFRFYDRMGGCDIYRFTEADYIDAILAKGN